MLDANVESIDPEHCACPDCLLGSHIPLNEATVDHVVALLQGDIADNTDVRGWVVEYEPEVVDIFCNNASAWERRWETDPSTLPLNSIQVLAHVSFEWTPGMQVM